MKEAIHNGHKYFIGAPYKTENGGYCFLLKIVDGQFRCRNCDGCAFQVDTLLPAEPVPITKVKSAGQVLRDIMDYAIVSECLPNDPGVWNELSVGHRTVYETLAEKLGIKPE